jgi:hypothetical protein
MKKVLDKIMKVWYNCFAIEKENFKKRKFTTKKRKRRGRYERILPFRVV